MSTDLHVVEQQGVSMAQTIVKIMQKVSQHSPPSPLNSSSTKKSKSVDIMADNISNNDLSQIIKEQFSSSQFVEQLAKSIVSSDIFINSIINVVKEATGKQQEQIGQLTQRLNAMESQLNTVVMRVNDHDQYTKRKDLLIYGIPFQSDENITVLVIDLMSKVGLQLTKNDFYGIHRLLPSKNSENKSRQAIIVGFLRITDRNVFYSSRKKFREIDELKDIFINEHLSQHNNQIYRYAKIKLDKRRIFTRNGNVLMYLAKDRSDHNFIEFKIQILSLKAKIERTVYDYNVVNWEKVNERFNEIPVHQLLKNYNKLNERVTAFEQILLEHIQYYVPNKKICIEPRDKVWFNDKLRILYKRKCKLYRKSKTSNYHSQLYKTAAEEFKAACIATKEDYYKRINLKVCASSKNWWSLVKNTLRRTRTTMIPALLNSVNEIVVDYHQTANQSVIDYYNEVIKLCKQTNPSVDEHTREKIEILNEYFAEVCTWTGSIIDSKIADCLSESKVLINKFKVVQPEVENILRSLDQSRACAPEITNRMIKNMAQSIVKPVCKLIYESFETSIFPEIWKNGVINPLYKS
ncbi:unnamed protein product, partial [Didymodactylos carnosus]